MCPVACVGVLHLKWIWLHLSPGCAGTITLMGGRPTFGGVKIRVMCIPAFVLCSMAITIPWKWGWKVRGWSRKPEEGFSWVWWLSLPWFMIWLEPEGLGCTSVLLSPFSQCGHLVRSCVKTGATGLRHITELTQSPTSTNCAQESALCDSSPYLGTSYTPSAVCSATRELAMATSTLVGPSQLHSLQVCALSKTISTSILVGSSARGREAGAGAPWWVVWEEGSRNELVLLFHGWQRRAGGGWSGDRSARNTVQLSGNRS